MSALEISMIFVTVTSLIFAVLIAVLSFRALQNVLDRESTSRKRADERQDKLLDRIQAPDYLTLKSLTAPADAGETAIYSQTGPTLEEIAGERPWGPEAREVYVRMESPDQADTVAEYGSRAESRFWPSPRDLTGADEP